MFSAAVSASSSPKCWNTKPTVSRRKAASSTRDSPARSWSPTRTEPCWGDLEPAQDAQQRGLARSGGPGERDVRTGLHDQIEPVQDAHLARGRVVTVRQPLDDDPGSGHDDHGASRRTPSGVGRPAPGPVFRGCLANGRSRGCSFRRSPLRLKSGVTRSRRSAPDEAFVERAFPLHSQGRVFHEGLDERPVGQMSVTHRHRARRRWSRPDGSRVTTLDGRPNHDLTGLEDAGDTSRFGRCHASASGCRPVVGAVPT